jgi:DNA-binding MarR family transcriptional regulator
MSTIFEVEDMTAIDLLHRFRAVAYLLHHLIRERKKDEPLSPARVRLLMRLAIDQQLGQGEGLAPSEISRELGVSRNTISALLNGLEDQGLIERHLHPEDRRQFRIRITASGLVIVHESAPEFAAFVTDLFASLSRDEQMTLLALIDKLFANLLDKAAEMGLNVPSVAETE